MPDRAGVVVGGDEVASAAAVIWAPVHQAEATVSWQDYFNAHRDLPMPPQSLGWTCSACAIDWVARATNLDPYSTREKVVGLMGYPSCINEDYGLMSIDCAVDYMAEWGEGCTAVWPSSFDAAYDLCATRAGILNSGSWYHFVAIRGVRNGNLWVANSAPGYKNIWDEVTRAQFNAWAGTWKAAVLD